MKKLFLLFLIFSCHLLSCHQDENIVAEKEVEFSIDAPGASTNSSECIAATEPKAVLVTIKDENDNTVATNII